MIQTITDDIIYDNNIKPKSPSGTIKFECDNDFDLCKCGCSFNRKFYFFKTKKCINPQCTNYYKGFPSNDLNDYIAIVDNGIMIYQWRRI